MIKIDKEDFDIDLIKYSNRMLVKDIWKFLRPYKWRFFIASFSRFTGDIAGLYPSYGLALIVTFFSKYSIGGSLKYFWVIMSILIVSYASKYIFRIFGKYLGYQVAEKIALDSQVAMIQHLTLLDITWHEKENAGNKLKRIQKGSVGLERILRMWINNFIVIGINFFGMIFILSRFDKFVGLAMLVFLASYLIISLFLLRKASAVSQEVDIMEEGVSGLMFQTINNIRSVKVLAMAERLLRIIRNQIAELFDKIKKRIFRFQLRAIILSLWAIIVRTPPPKAVA